MYGIHVLEGLALELDEVETDVDSAVKLRDDRELDNVVEMVDREDESAVEPTLVEDKVSLLDTDGDGLETELTVDDKTWLVENEDDSNELTLLAELLIEHKVGIVELTLLEEAVLEELDDELEVPTVVAYLPWMAASIVGSIQLRSVVG